MDGIKQEKVDTMEERPISPVEKADLHSLDGKSDTEEEKAIFSSKEGSQVSKNEEVLKTTRAVTKKLSAKSKREREKQRKQNRAARKKRSNQIGNVNKGKEDRQNNRNSSKGIKKKIATKTKTFS